MTELWRRLPRFVFERLGSRVDFNFERLDPWLPSEVVVEDTGPANTVYQVQHGLGRVPRGMAIVNQVTGTGLGAVSWYREEDDGVWTERSAAVRFTLANAKVRLFFW